MATRELYVVYRLAHKGQGKYQATLHDDTNNKTLATGGFPTVDAVKKWARQWAKAKKAKVSFERV